MQNSHTTVTSILKHAKIYNSTMKTCIHTPKYLKSVIYTALQNTNYFTTFWSHTKKKINASITIVSGQVPLALKRWNRSMQQEGTEFIEKLHWLMNIFLRRGSWTCYTWIEKNFNFATLTPYSIACCFDIIKPTSTE